MNFYWQVDDNWNLRTSKPLKLPSWGPPQMEVGLEPWNLGDVSIGPNEVTLKNLKEGMWWMLMFMSAIRDKQLGRIRKNIYCIYIYDDTLLSLRSSRANATFWILGLGCCLDTLIVNLEVSRSFASKWIQKSGLHLFCKTKLKYIGVSKRNWLVSQHEII